MKLNLWPCSNFFPTGLLTHSAVVLATQLDESYFTGVVVATRPGKLLFMVAQVVRGLFQVLEKPAPSRQMLSYQDLCWKAEKANEVSRSIVSRFGVYEVSLMLEKTRLKRWAFHLTIL